MVTAIEWQISQGLGFIVTFGGGGGRRTSSLAAGGSSGYLGKRRSRWAVSRDVLSGVSRCSFPPTVSAQDGPGHHRPFLWLLFSGIYYSGSEMGLGFVSQGLQS